MAPRRIYTHADANGRTITIGGMGGLNERFSQLSKSAKKVPEPKSQSVFSRIRATSVPSRNQGQGVLSRLGRSTQANVQKRTAPVAAQRLRKVAAQQQPGVKGRQQGRVAQNGKGAAKLGGRGQQRPPFKNAKSKPKTKLTADELDKSLDDYMMKDEKYAQSKLDAELESYMDDVEDDVVMDL